MKMAKPSEADSNAVLEFFQGLESILEYGEMPDGEEGEEPKPATEPEDIVIWLEQQWRNTGHCWGRVYWAGLTCIQNACDPDLPHLDYKPEIREREAEVERLKAENARLTAAIDEWSSPTSLRFGMRDEPDIDEAQEWDDVYGGDNDPRDWEVDG